MSASQGQGRQKTALVVGGAPHACSPELLARLAREADVVAAVDRGLDACRAADLLPDVLIGDADSATPESLAWAREARVEEIAFPVEKDDTDLGLALAWAKAHVERVIVSCVSGGRPDHALAVYGCLARHVALMPRIIEDDFECRILSAEHAPAWELGESARGMTFSFTALSAEAVVSEHGMHWELDHRRVGCLFDLGISNVVTTGSARIDVHEGIVAAFLLGRI